MKKGTCKSGFVYCGILWAIFLVVFAPPGLANAQEKFPSRPIQIINPYDAGGGIDLHLRPLATIMERALRQACVVQNKPGAGGKVGFQFASKAKADGYTIVGSTPAMISLPEVDLLFGRPQVFTADMFVTVALMSSEPLVLVVQGTSPWKNINDLIAAAKAEPGKLQYSSAGPYGPSHIPTEMFAKEAGIKLKHVPYTGSGPSLTALLGGHVDLYLSPPSIATAHMKKGTLKALGITSAKRHKYLPDVPTLMESGFDVEFYNWYGIHALKGTPAEALKVLRETVAQAMKDPQFVGAMDKIQTPITYMGAEEFQAFFERNVKEISETIKRIGKVS